MKKKTRNENRSNVEQLAENVGGLGIMYGGKKPEEKAPENDRGAIPDKPSLRRDSRSPSDDKANEEDIEGSGQNRGKVKMINLAHESGIFKRK